ncbi:cst complex subunit stn1 [Lynx pardinus]|uniref:CST complex subunit STN1 n=3 Tax=Lynx TaxID=13124 RepID=A0A485MTY1_LYNPA|nr:cst complex subunit stn1 [Lynx pardinus]
MRRGRGRGGAEPWRNSGSREGRLRWGEVGGWKVGRCVLPPRLLRRPGPGASALGGALAPEAFERPEGPGLRAPQGRGPGASVATRREGLGADRFSDAEPFRVGWKPKPSLPMESESSRPEEETPSLLWGLDPVFLAFAKLYIRDILDLKESCQVPGVFFYNGHPIKQVEILGTVIGRREKDTFYSYGVDDSTGVINCICWKKSNNTESSSALLTTGGPTIGELNLTSQLKKLQETIEQRTKIEIGDIIQIRGYIHTYREEREIRVTTYYKVDDPVCNIQIARMLELPSIYRKVYDQPFQSPALEQESNPGALDLANLTCLLSEKAKEFLVENKVQTFYRQELETVESLLSLASQPVTHSSCSEQVDVKNETTSKAIHSIFKNAIQLLQEKGFVFQKDDGFDNLYYVTREDKELHRKIHHIIQEDCQKPNHIEKGCHFQHILACARLSVSPRLNEAVLQQVLELLEDQSDIISTMEHYYTAF